MTAARLLHGLVLLVVGVGAPVRSLAQTALFAEHEGEYRLVRDVIRNRPQVERSDGKLVEASGQHYKLIPVEEFAPVYVAVRNLKVGTRVLQMLEGGQEMNHRFEFRAEFESAFALKNVFVVIDLNGDDAGKVLYVHGIGDLTPRELRDVDLSVPMTQRLGSGRYRVHVYSNGVEVFQSLLPFEYVERKLDQSVRKRIAGIKDAPPQPFVGPAPEYPPKLRRAKVSGDAVIRLKISPTGRVLDPEIRRASDPAFGESALAAARLWRFLPKIKAGAPTTATVDLPFIFGERVPAAGGTH